MSITSNRLREGMRLRGLRQAELARRTGISRSSICTYLAGDCAPKPEYAYRLAAVLGVNPAWLMGRNAPMAPSAHPDVRTPERRRVPLLGRIAAGEPLYAQENPDAYASVDADVDCDFALRVAGDSMAPRFLDGDTVYFRQQPDVDDGQIAAVIVDDSATLKHVYHLPQGVQLISENPKYPPMLFDAHNSMCVRILGLAVGYYRPIV